MQYLTGIPKRFLALFLIIPFLSIMLLILYHTNYQPKSNIFFPWQENMSTPSLSLRVVPRFPEGIRLYIKTENFNMSNIMTKKQAKMATGHVHLYINDNLFRMVSEDTIDISLDDLTQDKNEILVTLQSADHRFITINDQPVYARVWIDAKGKEFQYRGEKYDEILLQDKLHKSINSY